MTKGEFFKDFFKKKPEGGAANLAARQLSVACALLQPAPPDASVFVLLYQ
jgi:hypothetical protein